MPILNGALVLSGMLLFSRPFSIKLRLRNHIVTNGVTRFYTVLGCYQL